MELVLVVVVVLVLSAVAAAAWRARQAPTSEFVDDELAVLPAVPRVVGITLAELEQNLPEGWGFTSDLPVGAVDLVDEYGAGCRQERSWRRLPGHTVVKGTTG